MNNYILVRPLNVLPTRRFDDSNIESCYCFILFFKFKIFALHSTRLPCWHKRNLVSFYKLWGEHTQKYIPLFIFICKIIVHCRIKAITSPLLTFFIVLQQVRYQPSINNNKINICLTRADSFVISFCTYISIKNRVSYMFRFYIY